MPTPQETLDQRLASGEITEDDHERLTGRLSGAKNETAAPAKPAGVSSNTIKWLGYAAGAGIVILGLIKLLDNGLTIENLSANGNTVEFKVANSTSKTADAVFWVEQDGFERCSIVTLIKQKTTHNIRFRCGSLREGSFHLYPGWASDYAKRAAISTRVE